MKTIKFQERLYDVVDETKEHYVCGPDSIHEGYHFISKSAATVVNEGWQKRVFDIDASPGARYTGYTKGELWNGWECPRFTKEVCLQIAKTCSLPDYEITYNEKLDQFEYSDINCDEIETFEGHTIRVDNQVLRVYALGAWSWIWSKAEDQSEVQEC